MVKKAPFPSGLVCFQAALPEGREKLLDKRRYMGSGFVSYSIYQGATFYIAAAVILEEG
jgi:hypothetical protein